MTKTWNWEFRHELITIQGKIKDTWTREATFGRSHHTCFSRRCCLRPIPVPSSSFHHDNYWMVEMEKTAVQFLKGMNGSLGDVIYLLILTPSNQVCSKYLLSFNNLFIVLWLWWYFGFHLWLCWLLYICCCYNLAPEEELAVQGNLNKIKILNVICWVKECQG